MPSTSQSQRRLFGMVTAYKEGKLKGASPKIQEVSKHISAQSALDFARSVKGKPEVKAKKKAPAANPAARRNIAMSLI